jgi:hypothetical protein
MTSRQRHKTRNTIYIHNLIAKKRKVNILFSIKQQQQINVLNIGKEYSHIHSGTLKINMSINGQNIDIIQLQIILILNKHNIPISST